MNSADANNQSKYIDRHVGRRIMERRRHLRITQLAMGDAIDRTPVQLSKYEKGINRVKIGKLYEIAGVLGVDVAYFYDGLDDAKEGFKPTPLQRQTMELSRDFVAIESRKCQEALCNLARALNPNA